jgi:hypothetical protein
MYVCMYVFVCYVCVLCVMCVCICGLMHIYTTRTLNMVACKISKSSAVYVCTCVCAHIEDRSVENLEIHWSSNFSSQQQGDASSSLCKGRKRKEKEKERNRHSNKEEQREKGRATCGERQEILSTEQTKNKFIRT